MQAARWGCHRPAIARSGRGAKQADACRLGDREDGGVFQSPLDGDSVEALLDGVDPAYGYDAVDVADLFLDGGGPQQEPGAGLPKRLHERGVLELAHQLRPDVLRIKPM